MSRAKRPRSHHVWTPEEDKVLRELWPDCAVRTITSRLGRSWDACRHRAYDLGLSGVRWSGFVTIAQMVTTTGYDNRTLTGILRRYCKHFAQLSGVERAELTSPRPIFRRSGRPKAHRMVDPQAVLDAVAWWESLETRTHASARLGVTTWMMLRACRGAGVNVARMDRRPPAFWDYVLARWRAHVAGVRRPGVVRAMPSRRAARAA